METVLIVIHLMVVIAMIVVVLLQRSEGGALGMGGSGGGGGGGFMSARGTANVLTRTTAILATVFVLTSIALAILAQNEADRSSIVEGPSSSESGNEDGTPAPSVGNGILETLQQQSPQPSTSPQVPNSE